MIYIVLFEGNSTLKIQATNIDEAWDKATRLGKVIDIIESK